MPNICEVWPKTIYNKNFTTLKKNVFLTYDSDDKNP